MKRFLSVLRRVAPLGLMALACSALAADTTFVGNEHGEGQRQVSADPALWALSDEDTTIYLFGTVHMLRPGTRWFDDEVKAAFDRSDSLVLEIPETEPSEMVAVVSRLAINSDGPPTSEILSGKHRERYLAALKQYHLPLAAMDRVDPWMAAINLSVAPLAALGYREDQGVEKTLTGAAKAAGKPVTGLETAEQQLGFFDSLPRDAQIAYLNSTVDQLPKVEKEFARLTRYWSRGQSEKLGLLLNDSVKETPELAKVLLFDRNARWADSIEKRMAEPGTVFVAVGAGHLAGKGSVVDLLEKDGLTVRRLSKRDFGLN